MKPDVFFLSETHLTKARAEMVKRKLGYDHMLQSESDGKSGGLLMLWKKDLNVTSSTVHTNYLDIRINENSADGWRITGFYGEPSGDRKHLSWDYIRDLNSMFDLPWMIIGDFNEILSNSEKEGGNLRPQRCMQQFRDVLIQCNLSDLGFNGDMFTWRRGRIRERLDRVVANQRWRDKFPMAMVIHEDFWKSDHRPITVDSEYFDNNQMRSSGTKRMFEAKWLAEESFDDIVGAAWERAQVNGSNLAQKLGVVHTALHVWDRRVLGEPKRRLKELQVELNKILEGPLSDEATTKVQTIQMEIENIHEQDEIKWVQRSRANWMKAGDRNTSFFHNFATARKKRNLIKRLKDESGAWVDEGDNLSEHINSYFGNMFTAGVFEPDDHLLHKVKPCVTDEMNAGLCAPYTREEVKKALFNIDDLKAPGPDGLHAIFFKRYWSLIGKELTDEVLAAINSGNIPEGWNNTNIVLIPKVESPESITQYRPISLCNVIYKVISKVLAARLKIILPEIISTTQSAFVPGRLITHNVLVAFECYHAIKRKKEGKYGKCAIKLNMHKAYD
jgi:hypothetical protein